MNTDPIADLLTRIRNAVMAEKKSVSIPHSIIKESIVKILSKKGFIASYTTNNEDTKQKNIEVTLILEKKTLNLKRISKPGQRIYIKRDKIRKVRNGYGIAIYSTTNGIMTDDDARKAKCGGELICEVY